MRMRAIWLEDHQVCDVDDAYAHSGQPTTKHGCRCNDLEGHFDPDSDKHNVWVGTVVDARKLPDGCACNTVLQSHELSVFLLINRPRTLSASSGLSHTGVGCLLPTIKFT